MFFLINSISDFALYLRLNCIAWEIKASFAVLLGYTEMHSTLGEMAFPVTVSCIHRHQGFGFNIQRTNF